jgi:hypothetical protein
MAWARGHVLERSSRQARAARGCAQRPPHARILPTVLAACLVVASFAPLAAAKAPEWDQVANIKDAALRLAEMQRTQGATRAMAFIDACYKTHSLSSRYTKAFEACIAQDYLETQILALIYSRLSPETLQRMGAPTPEMLAQSMGKRITDAFRTYDVSVARAEAFKKLVDEHGFPVFFRALFPGVEMPVPKRPLPKEK